MKMKKILLFAILLLIVFLIYLMTFDKKVYYVALGDEVAYEEGDNRYPHFIRDYLKNKNKLEVYNTSFMSKDIRVTDLIHQIKENKKMKIDGKEQSIKNALIKADFVTLSIGNTELIGKSLINSEREMYDYIDEYIEDMSMLFEVLRQYCKEDIVITNYYSKYGKETLFKYFNKKLQELCYQYKIDYVDISHLVEDNAVLLPTNEEYMRIGDAIIKHMDETLLK